MGLHAYRGPGVNPVQWGWTIQYDDIYDYQGRTVSIVPFLHRDALILYIITANIQINIIE